MTSTTAPTTMQAIPIHNHMREPVMKLPLRIPYPWNVQTAPAATNPTPMTTAIHRNAQPPNQRARRVDANDAFSAAVAIEGATKVPVGCPGVEKKSTSTRATSRPPNSM